MPSSLMGEAGFTLSLSTMPPMPGTPARRSRASRLMATVSHLAFDGGDTVGIDGQSLWLEVGTDPLLAAKRGQCRLVEVFLLGHA